MSLSAHRVPTGHHTGKSVLVGRSGVGGTDGVDAMGLTVERLRQGISLQGEQPLRARPVGQQPLFNVFRGEGCWLRCLGEGDGAESGAWREQHSE